MSSGITWRLEMGDPTWIGWITVMLYLAVAGLCVKAGWKTRASSAAGPSEGNQAWIWWGCAALLLALGINKQLDLQTLLVEVGRQVSRNTGWYGQRRRVQRLFALVVAACLVVPLWILFWKQRYFFKRNPLFLPGISLVAVYILLRVASIDHLDESAGLKLDDRAWLPVFELAGLASLALAGYQAAKARPQIRR